MGLLAVAADNVDVALFAAGLAFLCAATFAFVASRTAASPRFWLFLPAAYGLHALSLWISPGAVAGGHGNGAEGALAALAAVLQAASAASLIAFAWPRVPRPVGLAAALSAPLVAVAALLHRSAPSGAVELLAATTLAFGLVGIPAAAAGLALARRARRGGGRWTCGGALTAYGVATATLGIAALAVPGLLSRPGPLSAQQPWAALLVWIRAPLAALVALASAVDELPRRKRTRRAGQLLVGEPSMAALAASLALVLAACWLTGFVETHAVREAAAINHERAALLRSLLLSHVERADAIAYTLAGSPAVSRFLLHPDPAGLEEAQATLDRYAAHVPDAVCFLVDTNAMVIASSDRDRPTSLRGTRLTARPYLTASLRGSFVGLFAEDATRVRSYHAAAPVRSPQGRVVGAAVVRVNLAGFWDKVSAYGTWFLASLDGVAVLASHMADTNRALWPLDEQSHDRVLSSGLFSFINYTPLLPREPGHGDVLRVEGRRVMVSRLPISGGWSLLYLGSLELVDSYRSTALELVAVTAMLVLFFTTVGSLVRVSAERLARSEELYRTVVESSPDWISIVDSEGRLLFTNPAGRRALGLADEQAPPRFAELWGEESWSRLRSTFGAGAQELEMTLPGRDGRAILWSFVTVPLPATSETSEAEAAYLLIGADVTAAKEAEAAEIRAHRRDALAMLAGGIAHQFNNINAGALGHLQVALQLCRSARSDLASHIRGAMGALRRGAEITSRLLILAAPPEVSSGSLEIDPCLMELAAEAHPSLVAEGISFSADIRSGCAAPVERAELQFIVRSLLSNACHALSGRKERTIALKATREDEEAVIRVSDSGAGMSAERIAKIFSPFSSDKGEHAPTGSPMAAVRGVGLSLSVCQALVQERGGRIEVSSVPEVGTTVTVRLPCRCLEAR